MFTNRIQLLTLPFLVVMFAQNASAQCFYDATIERTGIGPNRRFAGSACLNSARLECEAEKGTVVEKSEKMTSIVRDNTAGINGFKASCSLVCRLEFTTCIQIKENGEIEIRDSKTSRVPAAGFDEDVIAIVEEMLSILE
ncbi:MAG: hypothetical protein KDD70_07425 [Bdellovibrionales bacterium]|nr:hypothetical protein [Bdellovibrionales bacterium]